MKTRTNRNKGISLRTCLGCETKRFKKELIRLAVNTTGLTFDPRGGLQGRGAYCCKNQHCFQQMMSKKKKLARAFRLSVKQIDELLCNINHQPLPWQR